MVAGGTACLIKSMVFAKLFLDIQKTVLFVKQSAAVETPKLYPNTHLQYFGKNYDW
jgi:hypothetical protein